MYDLRLLNEKNIEATIVQTVEYLRATDQLAGKTVQDILDDVRWNDDEDLSPWEGLVASLLDLN